MKPKLKKVPEFKTEEAERAFWAKHDSAEYLDWSAAQPVRLPKLKPSTETISLRLPKHLLDRIRLAANSRDVPYQSLIKLWLQEHVQGSRR
jgi:predicted DNA binding CopG/RHH family protein